MPCTNATQDAADLDAVQIRHTTCHVAPDQRAAMKQGPVGQPTIPSGILLGVLLVH